MQLVGWLASLAAHGAVIGAVWVAHDPVVVSERPASEPIIFELVEAVGDGTPTLPVASTDGPDGRGGVPSPPAIDPPPPASEMTSEQSQAEKMAKVMAAPMALNRITPLYPRAARRHRHEGSVTVEFAVDAEGRVGAVRVVASSGHAELDRAALKAVSSARFAPAEENGVAVGATLSLTFDFRLTK